MKPSRLSSRCAMTLVEILIAILILGFAMAGVMTFYLYVVQNNFVAEQRLLANDDVRTFTETLVKNARASNYVLLYQSFYTYTPMNNAATGTPPFSGTMGTQVSPIQTSVSNPNPNLTTLDPQDEIASPNSGDYIVFVSYSDPFPGYVAGSNSGIIPQWQVNRLILYWVAPNNYFNGTQTGLPAENAIYMYDSGIATSANPITLPWAGGQTLPITVDGVNTTIESLLPTPPTSWNATASPPPCPWATIVLNDVRGLVGYIPPQDANSTAGSGLNFTNYSIKQNTSILMRTLILNGNLAKRTTDTYDFTITPGG